MYIKPVPSVAADFPDWKAARRSGESALERLAPCLYIYIYIYYVYTYKCVCVYMYIYVYIHSRLWPIRAVRTCPMMKARSRNAGIPLFRGTFIV